MTVLSVTDLHAGYGAGHVLRGVSLSAAGGEVVVVLGPNGAGKSTLFRAISGIVPEMSGRLAIDGEPLDHMRPHRRVHRGVVHVPEGRTNVIASLTVRENLRLCGGGTDEITALFPILDARSGQVAGTLSGGQQQMLAIALGLLLKPRVLLVDEPSAGLAPNLVDEVFARLGELRGSGLALVVAEQRIDLAFRIADRGYVLERGEVSASGSTDELRDSAALRRSYLGAE